MDADSPPVRLQDRTQISDLLGGELELRCRRALRDGGTGAFEHSRLWFDAVAHLTEALAGARVQAFHYTRVVDPSALRREGLRVLDLTDSGRSRRTSCARSAARSGRRSSRSIIGPPR